MGKITRTSGPGATPTEEIIKNSLDERVVTDKRGRQITIRKPGVLAQYRIVEVVGGETAKNAVYMNMILPVMYVTRIGEKHIFEPINKVQLEAIISELDEDGIEAVTNGILDHYGMRNAEEEKTALKK